MPSNKLVTRQNPNKVRLRGNRYRRIGKSIKNKYRLGVGTSMKYFLGAAQPMQKNVCLRYAQTFSFTTGTAGVIGAPEFIRLNSLYDPDQTGGGHQPYLFDTFAPLYTKYRVNACKVEVLWNTIGSSADLCCCSQISGSTNYLNLGSLGIDRATELPNVATQTLSGSGNTRTTKFSFFVNLHRIEGVSKRDYQIDQAYTSLCSTSPTNGITLQIAVGSYSGTTSEACSCQVLLTYYATFMLPIVQAQS